MYYVPKPVISLVETIIPLLNLKLWIGPACFILLGIVSGYTVEKLLTKAVGNLLNKSQDHLNRQIAGLLRGFTRWVFILWGFYAATFNMGFLEPGVLEVIRRVLFVLSMMIVIRVLSEVSVAVVRFYMNHTKALRALPDTSIFENIIRLVVYLFGIMMLLQSVGISVMPIITALGVGGLAISLALQDTLANMFAGLQMIIARQVKVGDYVRLDAGFEGIIADIGWRNTVIRQLSNNLVIVPNSKMSSAILTNFTLPLPEMSVQVEASVAYGADLEAVEKLIQSVAVEVMQRVEGGVDNFEPSVRYHTFGDSGIQFSVGLRVKTLVDQYLIKHEFIKALHAKFQAQGIEIPYPQRVLHVPNTPKLALAITNQGLGNSQPAMHASNGHSPAE